MTDVKNGTKTMKDALNALCSGGGALVGTSLHSVLKGIMDNRGPAFETLDALGTLRGAMANPADAKSVGTIQAFLRASDQSTMLKAQQPYLYLSAMATPGLLAFGLDAADFNAVSANGEAVQAYLAPTVTTDTIESMKPLITDFMNGNPESAAAAAMVLIAAADAGAARPCLPRLLANMLGVDTQKLAARLSRLAGTAASTNSGASHVLSRAAMVLREKAEGGSHDVLKDLAEKALRHHHKDESCWRPCMPIWQRHLRKRCPWPTMSSPRSRSWISQSWSPCRALWHVQHP
jgi:hypothetical protein